MNAPFATAEVFREKPPWLSARREIITGSDSAAALGFSDYKTPLELWNEKRNGTETEETMAMRRGRALEPLALAVFAESPDALPVTTLPPTPWTLQRHPTLDYLAATPDAITHTQDYSTAATVEAKTMYGAFAGVEDGLCPIGWQMQAAITADCCGLDTAWVQAIINDVGYRWRIEVNPEQMAVITAQLAEFVHCVKTGEMPAHTASEKDRRILYEAFRDCSETAILLDSDVSAKARRREEVSEIMRPLKKEYDQLTADLMREIGAHTFGILDDGERRVKVSRVSPSPRIAVAYDFAEQLDDAGIEYKVTHDEGYAKVSVGKYNPKKEPAPLPIDNNTATE